MSNPIDSRAAGPRESQSLQNVVQLAARHPDGYIVLDAGQFRIKASGQFSGVNGSMGVAWVESDSDATGAFLSLLGSAYSPAFAASIARDLGLAPAPGQPLSAHDVTRAAEIAHTGASLLAGCDQAEQWFGRRNSTGTGPQA